MSFGLPKDKTLVLCSRNLEDPGDFSSDKFQQSSSAGRKTCQVFLTLLTNAFEEHHAPANSLACQLPVELNGGALRPERSPKCLGLYFGLSLPRGAAVAGRGWGGRGCLASGSAVGSWCWPVQPALLPRHVFFCFRRAVWGGF